MKREDLSTLQSYRYCLHCGQVRERTGRPFGYFIDCLKEVQFQLGLRGRKFGTRALTEAENRLAVREIQESVIYADPYGVRFECQCEAFTEMIRRYRPGVPESLIEDILW